MFTTYVFTESYSLYFVLSSCNFDSIHSSPQKLLMVVIKKASMKLISYKIICTVSYNKQSKVLYNNIHIM